MAVTWRTSRRLVRPAIAAAAALGAAAVVAVAGRTFASDHQDTPFVELNARYDVNDVYAFPSPTNGSRVVLVLGTSSPLTPAGTPTAAFGAEDEVLYQLKVDNTGDAREDLVFQFTFTGPPGAQQVRMRGPVAPAQVGIANTLVGDPALSGAVGQSLGSPAGMQLFAGPRDDPFFIDLEAFFRVLPDRRPATGPLSLITQGPLTFRPPGQAVDFVAGINDLAIVVELPNAMLEGGAPGRLGIWGTISQ